MDHGACVLLRSSTIAPSLSTNQEDTCRAVWGNWLCRDRRTAAHMRPYADGDRAEFKRRIHADRLFAPAVVWPPRSEVAARLPCGAVDAAIPHSKISNGADPDELGLGNRLPKLHAFLLMGLRLGSGLTTPPLPASVCTPTGRSYPPSSQASCAGMSAPASTVHRLSPVCDRERRGVSRAGRSRKIGGAAVTASPI